jgi:hypothetical protein
MVDDPTNKHCRAIALREQILRTMTRDELLEYALTLPRAESNEAMRVRPRTFDVTAQDSGRAEMP